VWNRNLQHQFESISCAVCIYFSDKFYSCLLPCPNFCPRFFLLYFCPQCFALALFLPSSFALALKMSAKKRAREKSLFCPLIHFPMYFALKFCHCPCPLFLPSCSGQKKRARARAKFEGKIHEEMNQRAKKRAKPETTRMPAGAEFAPSSDLRLSRYLFSDVHYRHCQTSQSLHWPKCLFEENKGLKGLFFHSKAQKS